MNNIIFRPLVLEELTLALFSDFIRYQIVSKCLRRENNQWVVREDPFIDDWKEEDYQFLIACLTNTIQTGGFVYGTFVDEKLKGFVSVESDIFGDKEAYCDLTSLHISQDMRHHGIGKKLFLEAKRWAKVHGAKKLYISSHSAIETQAFYHAMGCVDALEPNQKHIDQEPYDRQLECLL